MLSGLKTRGEQYIKREIRKLHVIALQRRQKSVLHVQRCALLILTYCPFVVLIPFAVIVHDASFCRYHSYSH